ncbi:MAG: 30S ribosomal protein S12 methylthiotransferase RimO, partial [Bacilli bacterium]|nr:30S ribosomal protein S12 methylthiotransferase RimO [Bacilli bacterium]
MIKIGIVSLGCAKNRVDSEMILGMFPRDHFVITNSPRDADYIIVNTCGFIEDAKKESIDTIFEMLSYKAKVIITGCLAQRYYDELVKEIPEASLIVPIKDYDKLADKLIELTGDKAIRPLNPLARIISTDTFSAYLRISEGCNNFCAFCAIPFIRGRFVSRPLEE